MRLLLGVGSGKLLPTIWTWLSQAVDLLDAHCQESGSLIFIQPFHPGATCTPEPGSLSVPKGGLTYPNLADVVTIPELTLHRGDVFREPC